MSPAEAMHGICLRVGPLDFFWPATAVYAVNPPKIRWENWIVAHLPVFYAIGSFMLEGTDQ